MDNLRVNKYEVTVSRPGTEETKVYQSLFTEIQAAEAGTMLDRDGAINKVAAEKLCEKWTRMGQSGPVRYSYRVVED